jgi:hypothetical protein
MDLKKDMELTEIAKSAFKDCNIKQLLFIQMCIIDMISEKL